MPNVRLAARYAKSLLDLSIEQGKLEEVRQDMQWLHEACQQSRDLVNLLRSPIIHADKKQKIMDAVTKDKISGITAAFIRLLLQKRREMFLPEITLSFLNQYKQYKRIYTVKLTTAAPVGEEVKQAIVQQIRNTSSMQNIELETVVDDKIIGGFVLQCGDQLIDASILYDLKQVARQFENNDFIYKVR
ncbi:MAG: ATP synthase F1 subunit delta [Chitinophagaceae bacterium]|nr:ATP synthase F1 subunit delta [Chitinophagaceae bacterium]